MPEQKNIRHLNCGDLVKVISVPAWNHEWNSKNNDLCGKVGKILNSVPDDKSSNSKVVVEFSDHFTLKHPEDNKQSNHYDAHVRTAEFKLSWLITLPKKRHAYSGEICYVDLETNSLYFSNYPGSCKGDANERLPISAYYNFTRYEDLIEPELKKGDEIRLKAMNVTGIVVSEANQYNMYECHMPAQVSHGPAINRMYGEMNLIKRTGTKDYINMQEEERKKKRERATRIFDNIRNKLDQFVVGDYIAIKPPAATEYDDSWNDTDKMKEMKKFAGVSAVITKIHQTEAEVALFTSGWTTGVKVIVHPAWMWKKYVWRPEVDSWVQVQNMRDHGFFSYGKVVISRNHISTIKSPFGGHTYEIHNLHLKSMNNPFKKLFAHLVAADDNRNLYIGRKIGMKLMTVMAAGVLSIATGVAGYLIGSPSEVVKTTDETAFYISALGDGGKVETLTVMPKETFWYDGEECRIINVREPKTAIEITEGKLIGMNARVITIETKKGVRKQVVGKE